MKIVLVSSYVPFIRGGGRFIVEWLETKLLEHGHSVERFYLPHVETQGDMLQQILAYRLIDLAGSCDKLIAFRPPSHVIPHPNKVLWFIHHIRIFYDLWNSPYQTIPDTVTTRAFRSTLMDLDTKTILEAKKIYTNSKVVANRLKKYNGVNATPLYPPILNPSRFRNDRYGDEIVMICRVEPHKRQSLLLEAMRLVKSNVKIRICGIGAAKSATEELKSRVVNYGLSNKVYIEDRWISEDQKVEYLAPALAVAYLPSDEDSYGYPSLEAAHARKGVLTTCDSGGVLELVEDQHNGLVTAAEPAAIAAAMDRLFEEPGLAARLGSANHARIGELRVDWSHVVDALTS